jgi:soluble lytic murein transglycosylase
LIDDELLWERISLVMKNGRIGLASALAKRLEPADRVWFARWKIMHKKPAQTLAQFEKPDLHIARQILLHGIKRLARKKFEEANDYWNSFQRRYAFSIQQIGEMQRDLALASVKHKHPKALKLLTAVNKDYLNDKVSKTRFKLALRQQNWQAVADFITELSEKEQSRLKMRYWLARALEKTEKFSIAQRIYKALAKERDYYGFIAADHIGTTHQMQHRSIEYTQAEANDLMRNISIAGAREFYNLSKRPNSKSEWLLNARREWHYATTRLPRNQQAITAALAHRWGWHDRALMTAAKAGYYDDLDVRFPLAFYEPLAAAAENQGVDLSWVYGIVRQESAYMNNVRSRAGALGLMQLMPATGRLVAKRIGIKLKRTRDILDINTNVNLGTAYLRQMLDKFDGNYMLATAAYNAGPGRAKRWAAENSCMPADIWVELIPFNETRKYVRRVLFYTCIFESRLGQKPLQLRIELKKDPSCPVNL